MKKTVLLFIVTGIVIFSCSKNSVNNSGSGGGTTVDCTGVSQSFAADVNPIIQTNCATNSGCHGSGSNNGPGPLLTYNEIISAKLEIRSAVSSGAMPLGGSLTTAQKNSITCWIDAGAADN